MKRILIVLIFFQVLRAFFHVPVPALAAGSIIDDTFEDLSQVDMGQTTAWVDTANGWVTLALRNTANSLILYPDSYDITVINSDAVLTYFFNGTEMEPDYRRSINYGLDEPVSIAGRAGEYIVLDRGEGTARWYHYDGNGMVYNGAISIVTNLTDPRAIDVSGDGYDIALLDRQGVKQYNYDGANMVMNNRLSFDTGYAGNPVSLSLENDNFACVVLDKAAKEIRYYFYSGSEMVPEASRSIPNGLLDPRSVSVSKDGGFYLVIDDARVKAFNYDGSGMVYNSRLSLAGLNDPLAVAVKPGNSAVRDYAVLDKDDTGQPCVKYFAYGPAGMEEIPGLRVSGLDDIPYGNDQLLVGKPAAPSGNIAGLRLAAETETPAGTGITWEATVDGTTWLPVIPGGSAVRFGATGTQPNYRALLHTDDNTVAPKIFSVQLLDASLAVRGHAAKNVYRAGEAMVLWAETEGGADRVEAIMWWTGGNGFTGDTVTGLAPEMPVENDLNTWYTRHNYPADYDRTVIIPPDMPDGDYAVEIKAYGGASQAGDMVPIRVEGSQYERVRTRLDEQGYIRYE